MFLCWPDLFIFINIILFIIFSYGTCNLVLSFMPGKIIKIISAIGYRGNKELGIELLNASLKGRGIRSPLASLL